jgi:hypothetical protein
MRPIRLPYVFSPYESVCVLLIAYVAFFGFLELAFLVMALNIQPVRKH